MEHESINKVKDSDIDSKLEDVYRRIVEASGLGKRFIYVDKLSSDEITRLRELGYRTRLEKIDHGFGDHQISWI